MPFSGAESEDGEFGQRVISFLVFLATMGWGAYAMYYTHQMNDPSVDTTQLLSPALPYDVIWWSGPLMALLPMLMLFSQVSKGIKKLGGGGGFKYRETETPKDTLAHLDDDYMEKYLAKLRSEQSIASNPPSTGLNNPDSPSNGSGSSPGFGKRK